LKIYDVLVVGGGGAGLTTAIKLKEMGADVLIATKSSPTESQTSMAQGGINSASHDEVNRHIDETLKAGDGIGKRESIEELVKGSENAIEFLKSIGVPFAEDKRRLGGVSSSRANYVQDYTGLSIIQRLFERVLKLNIPVLNSRFLLNYIFLDGKVSGATFLNIKSGTVEQVLAKSVVIASGGYSQIYRNFNTNSRDSSGDGVATHIRNGGVVSNLEFIQFHPTSLKGKGVLISETARGEGGYLINSNGERFVDELLPRDVVSRAIYSQLEDGKEVFLDIRHLENIEEKMPQELKLIKSYTDIDPLKEPIPIEPVAHYTMGGISVDINGSSTIDGLFAVGEVAHNGVHGANRLGGNSLLELIVFGDIVAKSSFAYSQTRGDYKTPNSTQVDRDSAFISAVFNRFTNQINFHEKREFLGKIFYRNSGIFRDEMKLKGVLAIVRQLQREIPFMGINDKIRNFNRELVEFIEFGNMVELAEVILVGAINRTESRGSHYREDCMVRDDNNFRKETLMWKVDGILTTEFREIVN
jgi:succinate dehydrogenase / fumarate reductase flavoprotein subunit